MILNRHYIKDKQFHQCPDNFYHVFACLVFPVFIFTVITYEFAFSTKTG